MDAGRARRAVRRRRALGRPVPAVPRPRLDRSGALRPQPAAPRPQVRRHDRRWAPTRSWSAPRSPRTPSPTSTGWPSSWPPRRPGPRSAGCGSRTRRWPGAPRCRPGTARGRPCGGPTTRRSACAWTASTCSPAAAIRRGSPTSPARSCSSCSWPTRRTWTWTCSSGAGTTASSPAREPSTCPPSSAPSSRRATPARCRSRCSTTSSASPTRTAPPSTRCARCSGSRSPWPAAPPACVPGVVPPPVAPALTGHSFAELAVDGVSGPQLADALTALGFTHTGQHRSKPVQLWEQGEARVLLNASVVRPEAAGLASVAALGLESADPTGSALRAEALLAPVLPRTRGAAEAELSAVAAPDGTEVFFTRTGPESWPADFLDTGTPAGPGVGLTGIDHVGLTQPFDSFDEAGLFYRAVLGLEPDGVVEVAAPFGLVRTPRRDQPRPVAPAGADRLAAAPRRLGTRRARAAARRLHHGRRRGHRATAARLRRPAARRARQLPRRPRGPRRPRSRAHGRDARVRVALRRGRRRAATCTSTPRCSASRVFFEIVQRIGGYTGYGTVNSPVRMAAHRRMRTAAASLYGLERRARARAATPASSAPGSGKRKRSSRSTVKPAPVDRRHRVPTGVAPAADGRPDGGVEMRCTRARPVSRRARAPRRTAARRAQHAVDLGQRRRLVGHAAEHERVTTTSTCRRRRAAGRRRRRRR